MSIKKELKWLWEIACIGFIVGGVINVIWALFDFIAWLLWSASIAVRLALTGTALIRGSD
jgi:hypothetical protein